MNGRRTVAGFSMLIALVGVTLAPEGAGATTKGTTAFTCKETGAGGEFTKAHCRSNDAGSGNFSHVGIQGKTDVVVSNETTGGSSEVFKLKATMGGVAMTTSAAEVYGEGWLENAIDPNSGEHYVHGEGTLTFAGVTSAVPGCKVNTDGPTGEVGEKGVVHTEVMTLTTKGQGDFLKIEPKEGNLFSRYILTECVISDLNGTDLVPGSIRGVPDGSTLKFTHATTTAEGTLGQAGTTTPKLGIEGSLTFKAKDPNIAEDSYRPIGPTTVETS